LIKIHKTDSPVRPTINWKNAPAYKLATKLSNKHEIYTPLPHIFNVKGTTHLIKDLPEIPFDKNLRSISFDIRNAYSNVLKIISYCATKMELKKNYKMKQQTFAKY
jgi:hypothetical protein